MFVWLGINKNKPRFEPTENKCSEDENKPSREEDFDSNVHFIFPFVLCLEPDVNVIFVYYEYLVSAYEEILVSLFICFVVAEIDFNGWFSELTNFSPNKGRIVVSLGCV